MTVKDKKRFPSTHSCSSISGDLYKALVRSERASWVDLLPLLPLFALHLIPSFNLH